MNTCPCSFSLLHHLFKLLWCDKESEKECGLLLWKTIIYLQRLFYLSFKNLGELFRVYFSWKVGVIVYHPPTLSPIINLSWNFTIKGNQISLVVSVILRFTNRHPVTFLLWLDYISLINLCQLSTTIWFREHFPVLGDVNFLCYPS